MEDSFEVHLTPLPTAARVTAARRSLRWRIISTIISFVILAVILVWFPPPFSDAGTWGFVAFWVGLSIFWLAVSLIGLSQAKRDLARIQPGVSFLIDGTGIRFVEPGDGAARWGDIDRVAVVGGRWGAGPRFAVDAGGKRVGDVALSVLDASPSVLDSMVRAHSLGKHHLDARRLERLV